MNKVEPVVIKLAETRIDEKGVQEFASKYAATEWLNRVRPTQANDAEFLIELSGRACYKSYGVGLNPNITKIREDSRDYLRNVMQKGDGSILEHSSVTFAFLNVSRIFCYSEDTEVLTESGWRRFDQITGEEEYASLNPMTFELEYYPAVNYVAEPFKGKMVRIQSSMVDLLVTPNHRVFYYDFDKRSPATKTWKFGRADSLLGRRIFVKTDAKWKAPDTEKMTIPTITISATRTDTGTSYNREYEALEIPFDTYAKFLGLFDAEGSLMHGQASSYNISVYQSPSSPHLPYILETVREMGFTPAIYHNRPETARDEVVVRFCSFQLHEHLRRFGTHSYDKRVPDEMKRASARQIQLYLDSYVKGDGNIHKENRHTVIYTSSARMADDLQELALKAGCSASIRVDNRVGKMHFNQKCGGWIGQTRPNYIVGFRQPASLRPMINQRTKPNRTQIRLEDYDAKVFCVSVPPHELLYVRRNGKPVWCGNTHELVRHRAGTAMSQESLRYVRPREVDVWMPDDLEPVSKEFVETVEEIKKRYRELEAKFNWDRMNFDEKKRVTSGLRRILPDGIATNIVWTANHRTIRWVIEMRTDPSAEVEIRKVFGQVAEICLRDYPLLYSDFSRTELPDGTSQYVPKFSKV